MIHREAATMALAWLLCSAVACTDHAPPVNQQAALGGDKAARVGDEIIPLSLVVAVAKEQKVSKDEALRKLIDDAVAAHSARKKGLDRESPASWRLTAAKGRFTADRMFAEAKKAGGPTDEEIARISNDHWQEVDRPVAVRTVHVVAIVARDAPAEKQKEVRAIAEALREAVLPAKSAEDFIAKANAVPHPKEIRVKAEMLPATSVEGWITEGNNTSAMDPSFAKAANALANPGDTSGIAQSDFGFHVIRLLERIPEQRMPMDVRRIAFADEAYAYRARALREARLADWRAKNPAVVEPSAEALMRTVVNGSDESGKSTVPAPRAP